MSTRKIRSYRDMHRVERKWLIWNHSNWAKVDRLMRRAERHALKAELRKEIE